MLIRVISMGLLIPLFCAISQAQTKKKHLQPDAYKHWETLHPGDASADGKYIFYAIKDSKGKQTLYVKSLRDRHSRKYVSAQKPTFLTFKNRFAYQVDDTLFVEANDGSSFYTIENVKAFQPIQNGRFMLVSDANFYDVGIKTIRIIDMDGFRERAFTAVLSFDMDGLEKKIALVEQNAGEARIKVYDLLSQVERQWHLPTSVLATNLSWSRDNRSITFLQQAAGEKKFLETIGYIENITKNNPIHFIDLSVLKGWHDVTLSPYMRDYPKLSDDKKRLLIEVKMTTLTKEEKDQHVEIWQKRAKKIYPYQDYNPPEEASKLAYIDLEKNTFLLITDVVESETFTDPSEKYAVSINKAAYEPVYRYAGDYQKVRVSNLLTKEDYLLDQKLRVDRRSICFVSDPDAILYYKNGKWLLHNLLNKQETVLNRNIPQRLTDCVNCYQGIGQNVDGSSFFIFDQFDLWEVSNDGKVAKQLTFGRNEGIEFQFPSWVYGYASRNRVLQVDAVNGIYLKARNRKTGETGYYKWSRKKGLEKIVYGHRKYNQLRLVADGKSYLYLQETFDRPPEIVWQLEGLKEGQVVAQCNTQQANYYWGKSEMVHYQTPPRYRSSMGSDQNAALFYPAQYEAGKKYPLIVSIYEDNTYMLHEYQNPGPSKFIDFNPTDYTLEGYFVLQPNLTPRDLSNPGHSMLVHLKAAVDYMKSTGMIDETRIGLYGHSFGGYEALFAATQMHDFATIIAGAAITNMVRDVFSYRDLLQGPSFRRTERDQTEMQRNYFEIPELYIANSPFHHIDKIQTPILLWTGKEDHNVGWEQSVEFYMGMLRLEKDCTLLVYPGEDHVLMKPENMSDLDTRMKQWFGHYLKGEPERDWMKEKGVLSH